jgi:hypothetical protein
LGLVATALALPTAAIAGFEVHGPVVAQGREHHVSWSIKAQRDRKKAVDIDFSLRWRNSENIGYGTQLRFPIPKRFIVTADTGRDLSGVAAHDVAKLVVVMNKGKALKFHPRLAPKPVRTQHAWLRGLRFFDQFYGSNRVPRKVIAIDGDGHVLARIHSHRGIFIPSTPSS